MFLTLIFIVLVAQTFNMYIKRTCVIEIFIHFLYNISMAFLRISFRVFYCFMFGCLLFLALVNIVIVFVNILQASYLFHHHVLLFFHFYINIDKDADYLQSNNKVFLNDLWLVFPTLVLFLKV